MMPGTGLAGALGYRPSYRSENDFLPSGFERGSSTLDDLAAGRYGSASLSGLGALGDLLALGLVGKTLATTGEAGTAIADLSKLQPNDFIYSPRGGVDWGRMHPDAVSSGAVEDLPIRITRGKDEYGVEHLADERHGRIQEMGFNGLPEYLDYVVNNHNLILAQPGKTALSLVASPGRGFERNKPAHNFMAVTLQPEESYYGLTSVFPNATESYLKSGGKYQLWRQGAYPANPTRP